MSTNTHPNTPIGKFLAKKGVWHPTVWETIGAILHNPKSFENDVVNEVKGWMSQLKSVLEQTPKALLDQQAQDEIQQQLAHLDEWLKQLAD